MPESETSVVFRVLGVLAEAQDHEHSLALNEIADAAHLDKPHAQRIMAVLELAGAVRAESWPTDSCGYCITRYGRDRLVVPASR